MPRIVLLANQPQGNESMATKGAYGITRTTYINTLNAGRHTMFTTISESVAAYNDMLNEGGPITIAGMEFDPSHALDTLDPIAYKCGWFDYMDALGVDTDDLEDDFEFSRDSM